MDEREGTQRIEIELTERAPARRERRRRRDRTSTILTAAPPAAGQRPSFHDPDREPDRASDPGGAPVVTSEPDQIGGGPLATERGRLVAATLTVGVIALFVGWAIGRSGDDGSARTVDATTNVSTVTTVAETVLPGETVPEAETPRPSAGPTTSRPPRTTTTTVPPVWEESTITIDPRLAGTTDRLVAVTADGELLEVDLATGALRTVAVRRWSTGSNPLTPIAGSGFVAVMFDSGASPDVFIGDDPTPRSPSTPDPWATYWDLASETMWTMQYEDSIGRPSQMTEATFDGTPTGRTLDLAGMWPSGLLDPLGGIVVGDGTIGTYRVSADGSERLPDGRLIGLGLSHVLVYRCGDTLGDCGIHLVDRSTGEARPVPIDDRAVIDRLVNGWWGGPMAGATVTTDGRSALVSLYNGRGVNEVGVLDTASGEIAEMSRVTPSSRLGYNILSASWSGDERFAFVVDQGAVTAYDRDSGELFAVSPQLPSVSVLTVRQQP